jgi:hypothetical protein
MQRQEKEREKQQYAEQATILLRQGAVIGDHGHF